MIGRKVTAVVTDDVEAPAVIVQGALYLIDANDAFYGNPLEAKHLSEYEVLRGSYWKGELATFKDYWTGELVPRKVLEQF